MLKELRKAQKLADLVEIWFDEIQDLDNRNTHLIDDNTTKPLIYKVSKFDSRRISYILKTVKKTAYIDLDVKTAKSLIQAIKKAFPSIRIIISYHNFKSTPSLSQLNKIAEQMKEISTGIIKIATQANSISDSLNVLCFLGQQSDKGQKSICLCMGKYGRLTRLAGHLLGNYLMYAPMRAAHKTASGQLTVHELLKALKSIN